MAFKMKGPSTHQGTKRHMMELESYNASPAKGIFGDGLANVEGKEPDLHKELLESIEKKQTKKIKVQKRKPGVLEKAINETNKPTVANKPIPQKPIQKQLDLKSEKDLEKNADITGPKDQTPKIGPKKTTPEQEQGIKIKKSKEETIKKIDRLPPKKLPVTNETQKPTVANKPKKNYTKIAKKIAKKYLKKGVNAVRNATMTTKEDIAQRKAERPQSLKGQIRAIKGNTEADVKKRLALRKERRSNIADNLEYIFLDGKRPDDKKVAAEQKAISSRKDEMHLEKYEASQNKVYKDYFNNTKKENTRSGSTGLGGTNFSMGRYFADQDRKNKKKE